MEIINTRLENDNKEIAVIKLDKLEDIKYASLAVAYAVITKNAHKNLQITIKEKKDTSIKEVGTYTGEELSSMFNNTDRFCLAFKDKEVVWAITSKDISEDDFYITSMTTNYVTSIGKKSLNILKMLQNAETYASVSCSLK